MQKVLKITERFWDGSEEIIIREIAEEQTDKGR